MNHNDETIPAIHLATYDLAHLRDAAEEIAARFSLPLSPEDMSWDDETQAAYARLHQLLKAEVVRLLARSPEKLMNALYRIDVREEKVKAVFAGTLGDKLANDLTTLIIERQLQKMLLRQQAAAWLPDASTLDEA